MFVATGSASRFLLCHLLEIRILILDIRYAILEIGMAFFTESEQISLKLVWKPKRPQIAKTILRKKNRVGGTRLPDFRLYYVGVTLTQSKGVDQRNSLESPEKNPHSHGQRICDKGGEDLPRGKGSLFT